jgi:DNA-binding NtrC family response regulator
MAQNAARKRSVLVVEEDELVRMAVMDALSERGFSVLGAKNSAVALPTLESDMPLDLLIADVGLPEVDGQRFARMAGVLRPELKLLFMTGHSAAAMPETLPPRTKLVQKPIELHVLAMLAEAMIEER